MTDFPTNKVIMFELQNFISDKNSSMCHGFFALQHLSCSFYICICVPKNHKSVNHLAIALLAEG